MPTIAEQRDMDPFEDFDDEDHDAERQKLYVDIPLGTVIVTLADDGVVVDIVDSAGEVIATTWKTYAQFGLEVTVLQDEDENGVHTGDQGATE